jgi:site-specific DNA-methyltransferase (adenine-specific)
MTQTNNTPTPHTVLTSGETSYRFYLGDCLAVLGEMPKASLDAIVTSPPYNLGIQYRTYKDKLPRDSYLAWSADWIQRAAATLSPTGSLFLNVGAKPSEPWTAIDIALAARPHLELQNTIHWIKSITLEKRGAHNTDLTAGHYKPINSRRFLHDSHEFIFHFTPHSDVPLDRTAIGVQYQDVSNVARWNTAGAVRCRGNTWFIPYTTIQRRAKDRPHPATFPTKLPEMCLRLHGCGRIGTVADPFMGLGSTAVAAAQLGLNFVGIEMDIEYLLEAVARTRAALWARHRGTVVI